MRCRGRYLCILGVSEEPRAFELELAVGQEEEGQEWSPLSGHSALSVLPQNFVHANLINLIKL